MGTRKALEMLLQIVLFVQTKHLFYGYIYSTGVVASVLQVSHYILSLISADVSQNLY